ncbi:MAG: hypothetical protein HYT36_01700 [Candidatus Staskawiczbacteria bacterium]|nr:hypothetical protein [Candidatus Staskawiczbacteria bacterium]
MKNLNRNLLLTSIAVAGIVITGLLVFSGSNPSKFSLNLGSNSSKEDIAKKALDYINKNLLNGQTASLGGFSEESGIIKLIVKIEDTEYDSYVTKDGKFLMPYKAINMDESSEGLETGSASNTDAGNTAATAQQTCETLEKTDKPVLEAYVVSKCPFGLQMQRVLADVIKNAPDLKDNILVRYIGAVSGGKITAMHGDAEAQENLRQICIRDEQNSKYWDYISCHIKSGDVDNCLATAKIDKNKLGSCISDPNKGLKYAKEDFDLNAEYDIKGSPTLVINGKKVSESSFGGRTSESLKSIICCSSSEKPGVCSETLDTAQAATSFSEAYANSSSGAGSSANTNCAPAQ